MTPIQPYKLHLPPSSALSGRVIRPRHNVFRVVSFKPCVWDRTMNFSTNINPLTGYKLTNQT